MSWRTPWRHKSFVTGVALLRRLLRPLGDAESRLIRFLVEAQNSRVLAHLAGHPPRTMLLILPRCVKKRGCRVDLGGEMSACLECRACLLGDMARLTEDYGVRSLVAFRSHIAFAMARRERPDLILATACDDRMIKALRSVPETPALLTPLVETDRPCVDCTFDPAWFEDHLRRITGRTPAPRPAVPAAADAPCPLPPSGAGGR